MAQPQVDFYILPGDNNAGVPQFVCKLTEKAWKKGHKVYIQVDNERQARYLDELLWTFRDGSFVAHRVDDGRSNGPEAVVIGWQQPPAGFNDMVINLCHSAPEHTWQFARIAEVVDQGAERRVAGRERFRQHRQQGLEPKTHKL